MTETKRLLALDVLRGITVAGMILVNNPGNWSAVYAPLGHAAWNGLTPTDLVFPFFLFILGVSVYLSLRKSGFRCTRTVAWKIVRRTLVIFLIGWAVGWLSRFCATFNALSGEGLPFWDRVGRSCLTFDRMRILGVLQRLAICYGVAAFVAVTMRHRLIPWIAAALLAVYGIVLGLGGGFTLSEDNVIAVVDRAVFGEAHMYHGEGFAFDPEGLLSTIPSIAHALIGFCCGAMLCGAKDVRERMLRLFVAGGSLMLAGWLLSYGCPINKKIWSPSFVLVTCGMASSLLALLMWIVDVKGYRRWSRFFEVYGVNPLFLYVLGSVLSILLGQIRLPYGDRTMSLHGLICTLALDPWLGAYPASLAYALLMVGAVGAAGYFLYRKKIYIRI